MLYEHFLKKINVYMDKYQDFGFNSDEFLGKLNSIPYAQFINASSKKYGMAITSTNASLAETEIDKNWSVVKHEFSDGQEDDLLINPNPRLVIINRSKTLMEQEGQVIPYNKEIYEPGGDWKPFSYCVVWFLNENNEPISKLPFRLKCSGYSGTTFLKEYQYYNSPNSFCKKFLQVYKSLTGDRAIAKNDIFYAHAIYQPTLTREKVTSSYNGQSSFAVVTKEYKSPTTKDFGNFIIKNGSQVSEKIKEFITTTKDWISDRTIVTEKQQLIQDGQNNTALIEPAKTVNNSKITVIEKEDFDTIPF